MPCESQEKRTQEAEASHRSVYSSCNGPLAISTAALFAISSFTGFADVVASLAKLSGKQTTTSKV